MRITLSTATSTELQSSRPVAAAFCTAMKRASAAPLSLICASIAACWRCVISDPAITITAATISAIMPAHLTRTDAKRGVCLGERRSVEFVQHPRERLREFFAGLPALVGCLGQAAIDHPAQGRRHLGRSLPIGSGVSLAICTATATRVSPWNGRLPVRS